MRRVRVCELKAEGRGGEPYLTRVGNICSLGGGGEGNGRRGGWYGITFIYLHLALWTCGIQPRGIGVLCSATFFSARTFSGLGQQAVGAVAVAVAAVVVDDAVVFFGPPPFSPLPPLPPFFFPCLLVLTTCPPFHIFYPFWGDPLGLV